MEWQQTTFGELKAGDWYCYEEPPTMFFKFIERLAETSLNAIVYRLVSPEREALRLVVEGYEKAPDEDFDWVSWYAIAKEALEVKP